MSGITLRQLEIFVQVVEHGSFRRCADRIGLSQVSISEHVRELESRLKVPLFERHSGGPSTLTAEGKRAHRRAVAILSDLQDLVLDVSSRSERTLRKLSVAIPPFLLRHLGNTLTTFRKSHAHVDVKLDLHSVSALAAAERIRGRELDLAYFFSFDGEGVSDSKVVRIERLAIYVGRGHPLAAKPVVSMADLRATPAVHLAPENPLRRLVDRALEQAGAGGSPIHVEADEYGLILHAVQSNLGFACMFESAADEITRSGDLVSVPLSHPLPSLQVRCLMRHSAQHDAITSDFNRVLLARLSEAD